MLIFHLKKKWFDLIKEGTKTHEYRIYNEYWKKRIRKHLNLDTYVYIPPNTDIVFALGYPKKDDKEKTIEAKMTKIRVIDGNNTDLKYNGKVFDIEFVTEMSFRRKMEETMLLMHQFKTFNTNVTIIKEGKYKDINYIIKKVDSWHCAYIIIDKRIEMESCLAGQEITYSEDINDCDFVKDKSLGKYVIGWDYAHSYNMGTPIDSIIEDIKEAIETITEDKSK